VSSRVARCDCWHQRSFRVAAQERTHPAPLLHCELSNFDAHTDSQRDALRRATRSSINFPVVDKGLLFHGDNWRRQDRTCAVALMKEAIRRKARARSSSRRAIC
jgi:hypothetical protein